MSLFIISSALTVPALDIRDEAVVPALAIRAVEVLDAPDVAARFNVAVLEISFAAVLPAVVCCVVVLREAVTPVLDTVVAALRLTAVLDGTVTEFVVLTVLLGITVAVVLADTPCVELSDVVRVPLSRTTTLLLVVVFVLSLTPTDVELAEEERFVVLDTVD